VDARPQEAQDLGDIPLAGGRTLAGTVLDPEGAPLAGARVWVPARATRVFDFALR
jgi:hypothetical protein